MSVRYGWILRVRPAFVGSLLKRLLRIRRRWVDTAEGRFHIDPVSNFGQALLSAGGYEPALTAVLHALLGEGDHVLDVGANEGFFSVLAAKRVGAAGRVVAVEPQSRLQAVISRNLAENRLDNVRVVQTAVADRVGSALLSLSPDINSGSSGLFRTARYRCPTERVDQTTLDELVERFDLAPIKLMKIDIEGFEYEAVLGSKALFRRGAVEYIALELHPTILERRGKPLAEIVAFLHHCGYEPDGRFETLILRRRDGGAG